MSDTTTLTPTLAPCPWCGGEPYIQPRGDYVECCDCQLDGPYLKTSAESIAAWNALAADVARGKVGHPLLLLVCKYVLDKDSKIDSEELFVRLMQYRASLTTEQKS